MNRGSPRPLVWALCELVRRCVLQIDPARSWADTIITAHARLTALAAL